MSLYWIYDPQLKRFTISVFPASQLREFCAFLQLWNFPKMHKFSLCNIILSSQMTTQFSLLPSFRFISSDKMKRTLLPRTSNDFYDSHNTSSDRWTSDLRIDRSIEIVFVIPPSCSSVCGSHVSLGFPITLQFFTKKRTVEGCGVAWEEDWRRHVIQIYSRLNNGSHS